MGVVGSASLERATIKSGHKAFIPALEGVRGYAFIIVFLVHYNTLTARPAQAWLYPWFLTMNIGWLVVPLFFALSGYLITGILYDTRDRGGYFKVFYGRRALRVFPLYYLTLIVIFAVTWLSRGQWRGTHLLYLLYMQTFMRSGAAFDIGPHIIIGHLWSLAVEEHFYLLWPVVLYFCRDRATLLKVCYGVLIGCFCMRLLWPLLPVTMDCGYISTFTRVDGIVAGAMLALYERGGLQVTRFTKTAGWVTVIGLAAILMYTIVGGDSKPTSYANLVLMTPLANVIAVSLVVLLIVPSTWVSRICSHAWICRLGRLSYGLYVFHFLYQYYFMEVLAGSLARVLNPVTAHIVSECLAFGATWVLAKGAFLLVEEPALQWKDRLRYGTFCAPMNLGQWLAKHLPRPGFGLQNQREHEPDSALQDPGFNVILPAFEAEAQR